MWVIDFVQERFHNMSPGDFESMCIKAGDSEAKEGLKVEESTEESLGGAALAHADKKITVTEVSSLGSQRKREPWRQVQRASPGRAATACCCPGCKSRGVP